MQDIKRRVLKSIKICANVYLFFRIFSISANPHMRNSIKDEPLFCTMIIVFFLVAQDDFLILSGLF